MQRKNSEVLTGRAGGAFSLVVCWLFLVVYTKITDEVIKVCSGSPPAAYLNLMYASANT